MEEGTGVVPGVSIGGAGERHSGAESGESGGAGSAGSADYQRRWPDALLWGYSSLVPGVEDPLLHNGNQER